VSRAKHLARFLPSPEDGVAAGELEEDLKAHCRRICEDRLPNVSDGIHIALGYLQYGLTIMKVVVRFYRTKVEATLVAKTSWTVDVVLKW
jgi:hypothetical protein